MLAARPSFAASAVHTNGKIVGNAFHWHRIGVDPFGNQDISVALELMGIPQKYRRKIRRTIQRSPGVYNTPHTTGEVRSSTIYNAMVSGGANPNSKPWVATNVRPFSSNWRADQKRTDIWQFNFQADRAFYQIERPYGCNNWLLIVVQGTPYRCRCDSRYDACPISL